MGSLLDRKNIKLFYMQMILGFFLFLQHLKVDSFIVLKETFATVSSYKLNEQKNNIIGVGNNVMKRISLLQIFLQNGKIKIFDLGFTVLAAMRGTYFLENNTMPMVNWIQSLLEEWPTLCLSWVCQISAAKMKILPNLVFFFQKVIIYIPADTLNKIQRLINRFIWSYEKPCIKMSLWA